MLDIQLGRRNLTPIQRILVAEKHRALFEAQAKENLKLATGGDRRSEDYKKKNQGTPEMVEVEKLRIELFLQNRSITINEKAFDKFVKPFKISTCGKFTVP